MKVKFHQHPNYIVAEVKDGGEIAFYLRRSGSGVWYNTRSVAGVPKDLAIALDAELDSERVEMWVEKARKTVDGLSEYIDGVAT